VGCEGQEEATEAAPDGVTEAPEPANRALQLAGCGSDGSFPNVAGAWLLRFETASVIAGGGLSEQGELVTRYAVAELCQDGPAVQATVLTCSIHQWPVLDSTATCAAQRPSPEVIENLPAVRMSGRLSPNDPEAVLAFDWAEQWGLAAGAALPAEPAGISEVATEGVVDQDEDGRPGVTLRGSGPVPTETWAARHTQTRLLIQGGDETVLLGRTINTLTAQTILGGPATRVIRGRSRSGQNSALAMVRVDGQFGSSRADANGDGVISCAELAPFVGTVLAAPLPAPCEQ
jgi:hypothetical protein